MMKLHTLKPAKGAKKRNVKRVGRGEGSGRGKTSGRGTKGQKARSGGKGKLRLVGMKRMIQRIPKKRGFTSMARKPETVTVRAIAKALKDEAVITPARLAKHGLVSGPKADVKILAGGEIKKKWTVKGCKVTAGARAAIEKAGGSVA